MIRFQHVTKEYAAGGFHLNDVSFNLEEGEFAFLIGPSGAGKTTILRLILHELLPDAGTIEVGDYVISEPHFKKQDELRQSIGAIFQDFKIINDKTVIENIMIGLNILKIKNSRGEAMEALTQVGLEGKELFFPVQLSAGELQRLSIARAIAGGRKIILADEPTGNLDPITSWELIKVFRKISEHKTILFATHSAEIVNALKKRVITMKDGRITKDKKGSVYDLDGGL